MVEWLAYWPLEPEFAGSNPAEAVGFFGSPENPQYAFLSHIPALRHVKDPRSVNYEFASKIHW